MSSNPFATNSGGGYKTEDGIDPALLGREGEVLGFDEMAVTERSRVAIPIPVSEAP
jgi:hypothetical protein